ncbi:hypothetical protein [Streptomyces sp. NPDC000880]
MERQPDDAGPGAKPAAAERRIGAAFRTPAIAGAPLGALLGGAAAAAWGPNTPALPTAALRIPAVASLTPLIN